MVKVTLPLGGDEAHGQLGKALIFQGKTVKSFASPKIAKVQAQLDAQDRFQGITKTIGTLAEWGWGVLQGIYGPRWYSKTFQTVVATFAASVAVYAGFEAENQNAWRNNAPYQGGALDAGMVFYVCAHAVHELVSPIGLNIFGASPAGETTSADVAAWWARDLAGVFGPGVYDDDNVNFEYLPALGDWNRITDSQAYQGSYMEYTGMDVAEVRFFFYGRGFGILYKQNVDQSFLNVYFDGGAAHQVIQNNLEELYQVQWDSPLLHRGLHDVLIRSGSTVGPVNIDGFIVRP